MRKSHALLGIAVSFAAMSMSPMGATRAMAAAPQPIWDFNFNDVQNGVNAKNTGTDPNPNAKLIMMNYSSSSTPVSHRVQGGPSGTSTDYSFSTVTPQSPPIPYAYVPGAQNAAISNLSQVTVTGWYNQSQVLPTDAYTRIFLWGNRSTWSDGIVVDFNAQASGFNQLGLEVNDYYSFYYGGDCYWQVPNNTGVWRFWAITYDGMQQSNNVNLYMGTQSGALTLVGTKTIMHDATNNPKGKTKNTGGDFVVGADIGSGYQNGMPGQEDNITYYNGLLSAGDIENIRESDMANGRVFGDASGDGKIDLGNDFNLFVQGMLGIGSGWNYGDFNFDGRTNSSDFGMFIDGYKAQGGSLGDLDGMIESSPLLTISQKAAFLSAVPEPTSLALFGLAMPAMAMRRRRQ